MIERAIFDRTISFPGLNGLGIGPETVYADKIPENSGYPAIRYSLVDSPDVSTTHDNQGRPGLYRDRFQFDIYGPDVFVVKQIREELLNCWENFTGDISTINIQRVQKIDAKGFSFNEDSELHREMVEFYFWYSYVQN